VLLVFDPIAVVAASGLVAKTTLLILGIMSVTAWAVFGSRRLAISRLLRESRHARETFARNVALVEQGARLPEGPCRRLLLAAHAEQAELFRSLERAGVDAARAEAGRELLSRTLLAAKGREVLAARRGLSPLATIGSTAPFIGLFGTVWGVVDSFASIGTQGSADLAVVAPGIAEALIATAVGLVAAVPAVWFFNLLANAVRRLSTELDGFATEILNAYDHAIAASGTAERAAAGR
jgi:biopolymer transport protein TolQ